MGDGNAIPEPFYILGSFFYMGKTDLTAVIREAEAKHGRPVDFLADSGAFSAWTTGVAIDVDEYADWLIRHSDVINAAAGLDVIGDHVATARNTDRLRERVAGRVEIVPVFHVGAPWSELRRLCVEHPYVGLGGAVGLTRRKDAMMRWLVECHVIGRDANTRFHGFGQTRPPFPESLPWYSVDSSYWRSSGRAGQLALWDTKGRTLVSIKVGVPQSAERRRIIRDHGGDPDMVGSRGFCRATHDPVASKHNAKWMWGAGIEAMRRYHEYMRSRALVPPPRSGPTTGTGVKVYLAAMGRADIRFITNQPRIVPGSVLTHA